VMVILFHGGDFAASIFDRNSNVVCHKSFHKYIIRKKQGKKQSTNDKSSHTSSTGSQMRRENEKNLLNDITDWKRDWSDKFDMCDVVLVQIPDIHNYKLLFPEESDRIKVATIPFAVGKANHESTVIAFQKIIQVKVTNEDFDIPPKEMTPLSPVKDFKQFFPVDPVSTPTPIDSKDFDKFFSEKVAQEAHWQEEHPLLRKSVKEPKMGIKTSNKKKAKYLTRGNPLLAKFTHGIGSYVIAFGILSVLVWIFIKS
jgi:hypothetical protein